MQKGVKFQLRCSGCRDVSRGSTALFYECVKQREAERSVLQLLPGEVSRESLDDSEGRRRAEVQNSDCRREEHIFRCTALFRRSSLSTHPHSVLEEPVVSWIFPNSSKIEALGRQLTRPTTQG